MILDQQAGVRPRVLSNVFSEPVLVEDAVRPFIEQAAWQHGATRFVCLHGTAGMGKSWALKHLAKCFSDATHVFFDDDPDPDELASFWAFALVIYARTQPVEINHAAVFQLAPWTDDDLIEYLLARHPTQCRSVMQRVLQASDRAALRGHPETWSRVLDAFAADPSLSSLRQAVLRQLELDAYSPDVRELIGQLCLAASLASQEGKAAVLFHKLREKKLPEVPNSLSLPWCRLLVAARYLADHIEAGHIDKDLSLAWPRDLVAEVAAFLPSTDQTIKRLVQVMSSTESDRHSNVASLLHALNIGWRPERFQRSLASQLLKRSTKSLYLPALAGAFLAKAQWPKIDLRQLDLNCADLSGADLSEASLQAAGFQGANLRGSRLQSAALDCSNLNNACLSEADLSLARGIKAQSQSADLSHANLSHADFTDAKFDLADLSFANCQWTLFTNVHFVRTLLVGTDLSDAICDEAEFLEVDFREAKLLGACFHVAGLKNCNFEDIHWPDAQLPAANLTGSMLTGSIMPRANFHRAILCNTGLAEIQWENADLREADLREATFHMGSSRSGLINSLTPMEGSMTRFYTDDITQQGFKTPEEIRKANLRGADLRGANIDGVDFYLVDLRDALLDPDQRRYAAERGAILDQFD